MSILRVLLLYLLILGCDRIEKNRTNASVSNSQEAYTIPEEAFFVPGSDRGRFIYVKRLNNHLNGAYLIFYDSLTRAPLDSGWFHAICPISDLSFIPKPRDQFVKYDRDTLWFRSETGKVVCWMQKVL